jgi:hypothetical protein
MSYPWLIRTGVCKCGHSWEDHHLGMLLNKAIFDEVWAVVPDHPPYVPQECEFYGCNEYGGLDEDGHAHCGQYEEENTNE